MVHRTVRPATLVAAATALLATAGLAACGSSSKSATSSTAATTTAVATTNAATTTGATTTAVPAPASGGGTTVPVSLTEYKINPAVATAPAGRVTFEVTNAGTIKHQFTVIRTTKSAATVLSKQNPNDDIAGARGEIASIQPGATKSVVIKKLAPGHYAFVCALPGHYQGGMFTDFVVK